jgi:hypothetical protein
MMHRHPDWHARLTRYLALVSRAPFQPGTLDCATFAAGAVEAQTGVDLAADWRGYTSLEEGFQRLSQAGLEDHVALVASLLEEVPPHLAEPGDIAVLALGRNLPSLGVVQGEAVYVLVEDGTGLHPVPRRWIDRAFRVPA